MVSFVKAAEAQRGGSPARAPPGGLADVVLDKQLDHGEFCGVSFSQDSEQVAASSSKGFLSIVNTCTAHVMLDKELDHGILKRINRCRSSRRVNRCR